MSVIRVLDPPSAEAMDRVDLYRAVHKGLRLALSQMLTRIGAHDFTQEASNGLLLADLGGLLEICAGHLHYEDVFIHSALERRLPGAATLLAHQHAEHKTDFEAVRLVMGEVAAAPPAGRVAAGHALYLRFAAFVADDFAHMQEEETVTSPLLQQLFSDEELNAIQDSIIVAIPPERMKVYLRIMLPAMNRTERASMLGGVKAVAPPELFDALLAEAARTHLSEEDWQDLTRRLQMTA